MFNTLRYARKLEDAGVSREHAEAQVQIIAEILEEDVATKSDINILKSDINNLRVELENDISNLRVELKSDITLLEHRLVIKLGTIVTVVSAAATAVVKLL